MPEYDDLLPRCQQGDLEAFDCLFSRCQGHVFRLAATIVGDEQDAEDVTQEVFLRLFRRIGKFQGQSSFTTWLTAIVVNACRDQLRRGKLRRIFWLDWLRGQTSPDEPDIADAVHERQQRQALLIRSDGTQPRFLIQGSCGSWSPDGHTIVYTVNIYQANQAGDPASASYVYILDVAAEGSNPVKLPTLLDYVEEAIFSPDGSKIAFSGPVKDRFGIYVINTDGFRLLDLTPMLQDAVHPVWSPDGQRIAFTVHNSHSEPGEIYVINADGNGLVNVTNTPEWHEMNPAWSPDSSRLLFETNRDGSSDIYIVNWDGPGLEKITGGKRGEMEYLCPSWQP